MFKESGFSTAKLDIDYMKGATGMNPMDLLTDAGFALLDSIEQSTFGFIPKDSRIYSIYCLPQIPKLTNSQYHLAIVDSGDSKASHIHLSHGRP